MRYRYQVHELNVPFAAGTPAITAKDMEGLYATFSTTCTKKRLGKAQAIAKQGKKS